MRVVKLVVQVLICILFCTFAATMALERCWEWYPSVSSYAGMTDEYRSSFSSRFGVILLNRLTGILCGLFLLQSFFAKHTRPESRVS
jgi:ABC-type sulfate transport system permease component